MLTSTYIEKAEALLEAADEELDAARETAALLKAKDAAGKAWAALVEATRALFLAGGVPPDELPNTLRGTRYMLGQHADYELQTFYFRSYEDVHQDAYYDGLINFETLSSRIADIRRFIDRVREDSIPQ